MPYFPVVCRFPMHWGEMDALGHANHTRFLVWMESARIELFQSIGLLDHKTIGPILADVQVSYRKPIHYPANLWCGVRVTRIGTKSFTLHYAIGQQVSEKIQTNEHSWLAEGTTVIVTYDYAKSSSVRIPDEVRIAMEATFKG